MIRKLFLHSPVRYIVALCLAIGITLIVLISRGFEYRINYVDAFSGAGILVFFLGLLQLVSFYGAFENFGYAFSLLRGQNRRYRDLYEYKKSRTEIRLRSKLIFMPFISVGLLFLIVGIVLNCILL